jgi:hypothetical protein
MVARALDTWQNTRCKEANGMKNTTKKRHSRLGAIMELVRQLPPSERARLRARLDEDWQNDFDAALASVRAKAADFTEDEIAADVAEALAQVRKARRAQSRR